MFTRFLRFFPGTANYRTVNELLKRETQLEETNTWLHGENTKLIKENEEYREIFEQLKFERDMFAKERDALKENLIPIDKLIQRHEKQIKELIHGTPLSYMLIKKDRADLYFEAHITIEPVFGISREKAEEIAKKHGFKLAELLMQKDREGTEERSDKDTFMTGHSQSLSDISGRLMECVKGLQAYNFKVWRYKIEDTVVDSRNDDAFGLFPAIVP